MYNLRDKLDISEIIDVFTSEDMALGYGKYATLIYTKCEVKMAGYWPSSFFTCLRTEIES